MAIYGPLWGMIFGPEYNLKKVFTWRHIHTVAVLVHRLLSKIHETSGSRDFKLIEFQFWSIIKLLEFSILVQWEKFKVDQNPNSGFDLPSIVRTGPKPKIPTVWKWIKIQYRVASHVIINFGLKFGWTKVQRSAYIITWSSPSNTLLGQKSYARVLLVQFEAITGPYIRRALKGAYERSFR